MLSYIFFFFIAIFLYQLIFKFIIPIYRTTKQVRKGFREMKAKMNAQQQQTNGYQNEREPQKKKDNIGGDYIEFEEVK